MSSQVRLQLEISRSCSTVFARRKEARDFAPSPVRELNDKSNAVSVLGARLSMIVGNDAAVRRLSLSPTLSKLCNALRLQHHETRRKNCEKANNYIENSTRAGRGCGRSENVKGRL